MRSTAQRCNNWIHLVRERVRPRFLHAAMLLSLLVLNAILAAPVELSRQVILLPASAGVPLFADENGNGRCDLLVIDLAVNKLLIYRQLADGFSHSPDQTISLPPQTAWVALCDVDSHPGLELLFSTAAGLVYSRQDAGVFESEVRPLIQAHQPFADFALPSLTLLCTNPATSWGTNDYIPVMTAGNAVLYHRNAAYQWSPGPPLVCDTNQTLWQVDGEWLRSPWALGSSPAHLLSVQQFFRTKPVQEREEEPENEMIRKIMADMKDNPKGRDSGRSRLDVDGDGREDLVLWQSSGEVDFKTDLYLFLRGADQTLPERPTQVLHCGGFPIPIGSTYKQSPLHDLNGDGVCELVLLDPTIVVTSPSDLVETALSRGVECMLKIRTLHRRAYPRKLDASVRVRILLALDDLTTWPCSLDGDFNGDGRPDFLVRRSGEQWKILCSTKNSRWFEEQPSLTFSAPAQGFIIVKDLNGDGLSDIIWFDLDHPDLSIFLTPTQSGKGRKP